MVLDNLTKIGKIGCLLFLIGAVFFIVGFSVPYWFTTPHDHNVGLWQQCGGRGACINTVSSRTENTLYDEDWFRGTQALACLALIALIADFIFRLLFLCGKPKKFLLISVVFDVVTAVLAFLAAVVFGSELEGSWYDLSWGFAFDIIGAIFISGAAVCLLVDYCRR